MKQKPHQVRWLDNLITIFQGYLRNCMMGKPFSESFLINSTIQLVSVFWIIFSLIIFNKLKILARIITHAFNIVCPALFLSFSYLYIVKFFGTKCSRRLWSILGCEINITQAQTSPIQLENRRDLHHRAIPRCQAVHEICGRVAAFGQGTIP